MKAVLVRDVIDTAYAGDRSVRRTEMVEVEIMFPERMEPPSGYQIVGEWRIAMPALIRADPDRPR
jgi:hypothetical protein